MKGGASQLISSSVEVFDKTFKLRGEAFGAVEKANMR